MVIVFALFLGISLKAQDFIFTQFHLTPLNLNPALAGGTDNYRLVINYRENAGGIVGVTNRVGSISLDAPIQLSDADKLGIGIRGAFDRAGTLAFTQSKFFLSLAYQRRLFSNSEQVHTISLGFDTGLGQTSIDGSSTSIPGTGLSTNFLDFNAGVAYQLKFTPEAKLLLGASIAHLFEPNPSIPGFTDNTAERLLTIHGEVDITVSKDFWVTPRVYYVSQSGITLFTGIGSLKYRRNTQIFEVGVGINTNSETDNNELVLLGAFEYKDLKFAVSRDFKLSSVRNISGDVYEGSVIYEF